MFLMFIMGMVKKEYLIAMGGGLQWEFFRQMCTTALFWSPMNRWTDSKGSCEFSA